MVFGCSDDMLRLCPVVSQTLVGDLCILHRQRKILESSDLRPEFHKNIVSYHPLTLHIRKALFLEIPKRYNIPLPSEQHFSEIQPHRKNPASLTNRPPPPPVQHPYYITTPLFP